MRYPYLDGNRKHLFRPFNKATVVARVRSSRSLLEQLEVDLACKLLKGSVSYRFMLCTVKTVNGWMACLDVIERKWIKKDRKRTVVEGAADFTRKGHQNSHAKQ